MTLSTGPNTGLLINGAPGEGHYTELMRKWRWDDFLRQPVVKGRVSSLPTSGQVEGDAYIYIGSGANRNRLARWWATGASSAQWEYMQPQLGWEVSVADELSILGQAKTYIFTAGGWAERQGSSSPSDVYGLFTVSLDGNPGVSLVNTTLTLPDYSSAGFHPGLQEGETGRMTSAAVASGGIQFLGFTAASSTTISPIGFNGHIGASTPGAAQPAIYFGGWKHNGGTARVALGNADIVVQFNNGSTGRLQCLGNGTWRPVADNTQPLGGASNRWSVVYAGTGTISTSDAREKTEVRPLSAAELAVTRELAKEIGVYKWLASIQEKGNKARDHIGLTVQRVIEIMQSHELDPYGYGFICYDEWEDQFVEHSAEYQQVEVRDENGDIAGYEQGDFVAEAWTEHVQVAGSRYSFRMDELLLFIARGFEERLTALEGIR